MDCRDVRELAESYLSGQLLVETNHQVVRHLERCPVCRADLATRQELRTAVRRAVTADPGLEPTEAFKARLLARLPAAPPRPFWGVPWAAGGAAVLALVAALVVISGRNLLALARDAAGDHRNCAVRFNLAEKPISLEEAAARYDASFRVLETVPPAELPGPAGPIRVVDRHSCVFHGRRFAHVVLEYQGHLVSLLVSVPQVRLPAGAGPRIRWLPPVDGLTLAAFDAGRRTVFLVSDLDREALQPAADSLAGPVFRALRGV